MPNFAQLAREGSFQPLGTSNPPQSPVAWSTFVTGMDPGGHGIFDFVHRDPKTYLPISSATPPVDDPGTALELFGYVLPAARRRRSVNNRGGTPFWDLLVEPASTSRSTACPATTRPDAPGEGALRHGHRRHARRLRHLHLLSDRPRRARRPEGRHPARDRAGRRPRRDARHGGGDAEGPARPLPPAARRAARPERLPDRAASRSSSTPSPRRRWSRLGSERALLREGEWSTGWA